MDIVGFGVLSLLPIVKHLILHMQFSTPIMRLIHCTKLGHYQRDNKSMLFKCKQGVMPINGGITKWSNSEQTLQTSLLFQEFKSLQEIFVDKLHTLTIGNVEPLLLPACSNCWSDSRHSSAAYFGQYGQWLGTTLEYCCILFD